MAATSIEAEIRSLLSETRTKAQRYRSAEYRDADRPAASGLSMRLEAIEDGLIHLARAIDALGGNERRKEGGE